MAALMIQVPDSIAQLLSGIEVPGDPPNEPKHITVMYLGDGCSVDHLADMIPIIYSVVESTKPFDLSISEVSTFPAGKHGTPVIAKIDSPALHELRERLTDAFDHEGLEYDTKFPEFKPHVTLSYFDGTARDFWLSSTIRWSCTDLTLWGADRGLGTLLVQFPFGTIGKRASLANRALVKLASWGR